MTTSGSVDFNLTRDQIITLSLKLIGAIDSVNPITPEQQTTCSQLLNAMIKTWQTNTNLWPISTIVIPLAYPAKQSYTIGPSGYIVEGRPLEILNAIRSSSDGVDIEIETIARADYKRIPSKSTTGQVLQVYYDPQLINGVLYVWPTSPTTGLSLVDGSTDLWTLSGSGTSEYYYTGSLLTSAPTYVFQETVPMEGGTIGSLAAGEYVWGDNDGLGSSTLYVRTSGSIDPDTQSEDYIESILTNPYSLELTVKRSLEDFDTASNTPDFPQEWIEAIVYNLAVRVGSIYGINIPQSVLLVAQSSLSTAMDFDNEMESIMIRPRVR